MLSLQVEVKRLRDGSAICSLEGVSDWEGTEMELQSSDLDSNRKFATDTKCTPRGSQNLEFSSNTILIY